MAPSVGASHAGHKGPIVPAGGGLAGQGWRWELKHVSDSSPRELCTPKHHSPDIRNSLAPPAPYPRTSASSPQPTTMEEDIALHRSCLSTPGSPSGPSHIPGPSRQRDSPLDVAASTKRSCLSVTLRRAGGGGRGLPWERLRGLAPFTPIPPRPMPVAAERPQRHGGSDGAKATPVAKTGVSCAPPRSGGSPLTCWARGREAPRGPSEMTWSPAWAGPFRRGRVVRGRMGASSPWSDFLLTHTRIMGGQQLVGGQPVCL